MKEDQCPKTKTGTHLWYSETAHPCRVQNEDWCIRCGKRLVYGRILSSSHTPASEDSD